jgi:outer membrane protein OmpA-like peptidoglycan-associated protein
MTKGRDEDRVHDMSDSVVATAWLFGFRTDSAALHPKHCSWLDSQVVPLLAGGGSVTILGLASRSGSAAHNLALSKRRASAVLAYLRRKVRKHFSVRDFLAKGESLAELQGKKDGTENIWDRAVQVTAWRRPTPPQPKSTRRP